MAEAAMHDDGLSPTSKKILKECTVELPAAAVKDSRISFVARPPSSSGQDAGFYFARPTLPRRAFTSHPQARSSRATSEEDKGLSQRYQYMALLLASWAVLVLTLIPARGMMKGLCHQIRHRGMRWLSSWIPIP